MASNCTYDIVFDSLLYCGGGFRQCGLPISAGGPWTAHLNPNFKRRAADFWRCPIEIEASSGATSLTGVRLSAPMATLAQVLQVLTSLTKWETGLMRCTTATVAQVLESLCSCSKH